MKKYANPEIIISRFSTEEIMAASGSVPSVETAEQKLTKAMPVDTAIIEDWTTMQ